MKTTNSQKTQKLTAMAILIALVIVLQTISVAIGNINPTVGITLALVPIVVGAILYGPLEGAILGAVMGIVVAVSVLMQVAGPLSAAMFLFNPALTLIACVIKTTLAGAVCGLLYQLIAKTGKEKLAIIVAAIACPIVNTGIFVFLLLTIFHDPASTLAKGDLFALVFTSILLMNFVPEFILNSAISPAIVRIISVVRKNKKK